MLAPLPEAHPGTHPAANAALPETLADPARAAGQGRARTAISFRRVNAPGSPEHDPALQRHHLLPRQLLGQSCFGGLFDAIGRTPLGFDDFRANGMLLPSTEDATIRTGMPLHRGPHRRYNELVIERVGQIEARWATLSKTDPQAANEEALMRLRLLQSALRRRLLSDRARVILNRKDPIGTGFDFSELDAMAESLWSTTGAAD
jgi:hypothetical protein